MVKVKLLRYTTNPVDAIEEAASTCYDSSPTGGKIMNHCYKSGHHSVLEFADFTFKISGVSRALTHQLVRHRLASYAQRSQRYCKETGFEFVTPPSIENNPGASALYNEVMEYLTNAYAALLAMDIPGEDARMVLPNACCSEICVKMNLRNFMNFCNERLCSCAQWEIRRMAKQMVKEVLAVAPDLKDFLVPKCEKHKPYCFCTETKKRSCGRYPILKDLIGVPEEDK
jgi:thymidylate synthase (FAD)